MRHFKTKKEAQDFADSKNTFTKNMRVFKKLIGHKNRINKPFVVGSEMEWLNLS